MSLQSIRHAVVVIPARDEAASLERTLRSVDLALSTLPCGVSGECVLVLDSCRDDSTEVVADVAPHLRNALTTLASDVGCSGGAREAGTRTALDRLAHDRRSVWLANTDADTVVPADWLTVQLELADRGADAVAGIVELDPDVDEHLRQAFGAAYTLGHDGTHRHVHGANLGVRANSFDAVGGWRPLRTGEDHDLWNRLLSVGRCVSTTASVVRTSARLVGRAPRGFAADLAALAHDRRTVA